MRCPNCWREVARLYEPTNGGSPRCLDCAALTERPMPTDGRSPDSNALLAQVRTLTAERDAARDEARTWEAVAKAQRKTMTRMLARLYGDKKA